MGATSEHFWLHRAVGGVRGPFLEPLTRTECTLRDVMAGWVEASGGWQLLHGAAWEVLAHPVDREIKRHDVVVERRLR